MADQRLLLKHGTHELTLAVRHGDDWRAARDDDNDLGVFLTGLPHDSILTIGYDSVREYQDPLILLDVETAKADGGINDWRVTYGSDMTAVRAAVACGLAAPELMADLTVLGGELSQNNWTNETPSEPGWYWHSKCSWPDRAGEGPFAVLVEHDRNELIGWVPFMDYSEPVAGTTDAWPGQWLGPVVPPMTPNVRIEPTPAAWRAARPGQNGRSPPWAGGALSRWGSARMSG